MDAFALPPSLRGRVAPLADRSPAVLLFAVAPVVVTGLLFVAYAPLVGIAYDAVSQLTAYGLYGLANVLTLGALALVLDRSELRAAVPVERPSGAEVAAGLLAVPVGVGVYLVTDAINEALGLEFGGLAYSLDDPVAVALVFLGAVVVAPVAEEALFRGLVLGYLVARGWGAVVAGGATVVLFAVVHAPNFGAGGVVFVLAWGLLPTALRLRSDNLVGAWLLHAANNAFAYLVVAG